MHTSSSEDDSQNQRIETENGNYYGEIDSSLNQGVGIFQFSNDEKYSGYVENQLMEGIGTLEFSNGDTYTGNFIKGLMDGFGEYTYCNGDVFKGYFEKGMRNGRGLLCKLSENKSLYGNWKHNVIDGVCYLFEEKNVEKRTYEWGRLVNIKKFDKKDTVSEKI